MTAVIKEITIGVNRITLESRKGKLRMNWYDVKINDCPFSVQTTSLNQAEKDFVSIVDTARRGDPTWENAKQRWSESDQNAMLFDIERIQKKLKETSGFKNTDIQISLQGRVLSDPAANFLWVLIYEGCLMVSRDLLPLDESFENEAYEVITTANLGTGQSYEDLVGQREIAVEHWSAKEK